MNLIMKMIGFKSIKTHIIRYKKLDIMRFILKNFSKFPTQIKFSPSLFLDILFITLGRQLLISVGKTT